MERSVILDLERKSRRSSSEERCCARDLAMLRNIVRVIIIPETRNVLNSITYLTYYYR